ncbi:MAG: hypothetical protein RSB34_03310, partial [Muribaculaceae bacterium]
MGLNFRTKVLKWNVFDVLLCVCELFSQISQMFAWAVWNVEDILSCFNMTFNVLITKVLMLINRHVFTLYFANKQIVAQRSKCLVIFV